MTSLGFNSTEQYASIAAAVQANKLPSTEQLNKNIDRLLTGPLISVEHSGSEGQLSEHGRSIATSVREILDAYKQLGANKNGDDQLQEAIYNLSQDDLANHVKANVDTSVVKGKTSGEPTSDAQKLAEALRTLTSVFLTHVSSEGTELFGDFASFSRVVGADIAETVEARARDAKTSLRDVESEVQEGNRDKLGRQHTEGEDNQPQDTRAKFEQNADTVKSVGSTAIGTGQRVKSTTNELSEKAQQKLMGTADNILERARRDEEYHRAISTIFDLAEKYFTKSLDTVSESAETTTSIDDLINDPTGRVPAALRSLRIIAERLGGDKSFDPLFAGIRQCAVDIRNDPELRKFFEGYFQYTRRVLDDIEYSNSQEREKDAQRLQDKWDSIMAEHTEGRAQWSRDIETVQREWTDYQSRVKRDPDVQRLKESHVKLAKEVASLSATAAGSAAGAGIDTAWIWQDVLNVYTPRLFDLLKDIPLPRIEYTSPEADFVIEDMDISSLQLFPGHAHISHTVDMDISQPAVGAKSDTSMASKTTLKFEAVQLTLREVSFYFHDKKSSGVAPSQFTGLLDIDIPKKGIDVHVRVALIPTTDTRKRERRGGFLNIEKVDVSLADDVTINIRKSNHQILISTFKSAVRTRVRKALETTLAEQVRLILEIADKTAYDTYRRAGVFKDTGAPVGAAYLGGFLSELGKMRREPGMLSGWRMDSTGVVKDDDKTDSAFAMGTGPQLISGDKHGPRGTISDETRKGLEEGARDIGKKAETFSTLVERKAAEEKKQEGWRSSAFDALI